MGRLLVLDGLDCSGKETQTKILEEKLVKMGLNASKVSFPNYRDESSSLVTLYLDGKIHKNPFLVNPWAASSFYACDRYISYEKSWKESYVKSDVLVADRYISSNIIHQMPKIEKNKWEYFISWVYDYEVTKLGLPKEDMLIYLDINTSFSSNLLAKKKMPLDIHEKNLSYLKACREAALFAAKKLGWFVLKCYNENGVFSIANIAKKIEELVSCKLLI